MKKQLLKKFSAFIVTAIMFSFSANAQIVYTDVIPDSTMNCINNTTACTHNYNLDLDNDAITDFILIAFRVDPPQLGNPVSSYVTVSPLNGGAVKDTLVGIDVSIPLQFNAVIDSNLLLNQSWQTSASQSLKSGIYGGGIANDTVWGIWDSLSDYYLGLRILQSGQTHYGWVRLRVDATYSYASLIVKEYAYNSIPNQPILTGQTIATGINENSLASFIKLYPNPARDHFTIEFGNTNQQADVTIMDISGKVIYISTTTEANKLEVNTSEFAEGIYMVKIQSGDFTAKKKLVIAK